MKYSSNDYRELDKDALQIRIDYDVHTKYVDVFTLAKKMNMLLVPYSSLTDDQLLFINIFDELKDGFTVFRKENGEEKIYTFYRDIDVSKSRQRFTIAHEIKHVIYHENEPSEKDEDLANHFARQLLAPTCLVMKYLNDSPFEIVSTFDISFECALCAYNHAENRVLSNCSNLDQFEVNFIETVVE